jgi:hypothetical protein
MNQKRASIKNSQRGYAPLEVDVQEENDALSMTAR